MVKYAQIIKQHLNQLKILRYNLSIINLEIKDVEKSIEGKLIFIKALERFISESLDVRKKLMLSYKSTIMQEAQAFYEQKKSVMDEVVYLRQLLNKLNDSKENIYHNIRLLTNELSDIVPKKYNGSFSNNQEKIKIIRR
mgnify:CR=1 FL=1